MINRQELNKIKEKLERKKDEPCWINIFVDEDRTTFERDNERLLEIIKSAEEFGSIDGRKERQEANTTALHKVLTDCGMDIPIEYGFGYMLYRLKTVMDHIPNEPKVLDADLVEIKPGDELYYTANTFLDGKKPRIIESVHTEKNPGGGNEPWVRFHSGWEYAHRLTHQKPETLQDVIDDLYKQVPNQEFGHIIRVPIDLIDRLEAIAKRMGGDA